MTGVDDVTVPPVYSGVVPHDNVEVAGSSVVHVIVAVPSSVTTCTSLTVGGVSSPPPELPSSSVIGSSAFWIQSMEAVWAGLGLWLAANGPTVVTAMACSNVPIVVNSVPSAETA